MQPTPCAGAADSTMQASVFEGLFVHTLKPSGAFLEDLRRAGFDPQVMEPSYPTPVFKACLAVATRHTAPGAPEPEALRALGGRFLDGYFQTLTGRLLAPLLGILGTEALIKRLPRMLTVGTPSTRVEAVQEGPQAWRLLVSDPCPLPDFLAGIVTAALARTKVQPRVEVRDARADGYVLRLTW